MISFLICLAVYLGLGYLLYLFILDGDEGRELAREKIRELRPDLAESVHFGFLFSLMKGICIFGWPVVFITIAYDLITMPFRR